MKNKDNLRTISRIVLYCIVVIGVLIAFDSQPAKDLGLDALFGVLTQVVIVVWYLFWIKKQWKGWKLWQKIGITIIIALMTFSTVNEIVDEWPRLPWVKAEAFTTVDEFMTDLQEKNYAAAMTVLTPRMQRCINPSDLDQPDAQPISWELTEIQGISNIHGTATFVDGQELALTVRIEWADKQWWINGFWFGNWPEERLDFSSVHCGEE
ncbi:MAG: hypothetical protein JW892_03455 [Anaerolineae bacterium]|nr:hypothetical protein [Anaerolineae bacterium]